VRKSDLTFTNQNNKLGKKKIKKFILEQNFKEDPIGMNFFVTIIENGSDDETTRSEICAKKEKGFMKQLDIDTKKGWIKLNCEGGCIELHKIRYHCCHHGLAPIPRQLGVANKICKDKERCELTDNESTFGNPGCKGSRRLWIWYSCNGGVDKTTHSKLNVCYFS